MDGEPPQEEDFSQIPLVERSQHKNWKARLSAYTDIIAKSAKTASDSDPFFRPYVNDGPLLRKWCLDANAVAQEKGIEAVLAIVQYSGETSAKTRVDVVPGLVDKALGATRAGTKKKGAELCAMYVEVDNTGEAVISEVLVGLDSKQPKVVAGSIACLKDLIEQFGVPSMGNIKPLLKTFTKIFGHTDKNVRAEGTSLVLSLYPYLGPALLPSLAELKPVQMAEIQKSFDSLDAEGKGAGTGKPTRYTRKTQREREAAEASGAADDEPPEEAEAAAPIDPRDLMDPVNALSMFPSDLEDRLSSTKWKDRLEVLEECNKVLAAPGNAKISDSNIDSYGSLAGTLGAKCKSDANVNVVIEASKVIEGLARGIGKPFGRFRGIIMVGCLERLKERKANVVEALGKALDALFSTVSLSDIVDDVLTSLKSKNPQVKEGTLKFLHRSLQTTLDAPGKDQVKPMAEALVALLGDSVEPVRSSAAECLGTTMKILGERAFNPYIEGVGEIQMGKVKDAFEKAEIKFKAGGAKVPPKAAVKSAPGKAAPGAVKKPVAKPTPSSPPIKSASSAFGSSSPPIKSSGKFDVDELLDDFDAPPARPPPARFAKPGAPKAAAAPPASRPGPPVKKPTPAPAAGPSKPAATAKGGPSKTLAVSPTEPVKFKYTPEDAAAQAADAIPQEYQTKLADGAWKVRLEAAEEMVKWAEEGAADAVDSEVLFRFLGKTPGWGEKNFQVSGKLYQVMTIMAERSPSFGKPSAALSIGHLCEKLGDMKLKKPSGDALSMFAEKTSLAFVLAQAYEPMQKQKAPKAQADAYTWVKQQLTDFGIAGIPLRDLIAFVKTGLQSPNALVRASATQVLVTIRIFVGADISGFLEDLNPQLLGTINSEFDKVSGQTPAEPTKTSADLHDAAPAAGGKGKAGAGGDPLDDLIPRVDLDKLVNQTSVLADARSDAWKVRKEAFEALNALLEVKTNSRLKPNMGEIGTVLKKAMADTNLSVKMLALGIISKIATGMGPAFDKHSRIVVAAVAGVCADQKATTRSAGIATLSAMSDACGSMDSLFPGLGASLESPNPALRASVLTWLAERLTSDPPGKGSDMTSLAGPIIHCLEDRNGDVRKGAGIILPFVVQHAGYEYVMDQASSLKPASKATIVPLITAARGNAPAGNNASAASSSAPAKTASAAGTARPKVVASSAKAPDSPKPAPAAARGIAPPGRSLAMKALAPSTRPIGGEDRATALPKVRTLARPASVASQHTTASSSSGKTIPFTSTAIEARAARVKRDATRWILDTQNKDLPEYLMNQMEPHTAPEIFAQLFSKDHRAEEDYMAGTTHLADFFDRTAPTTFGVGEEEVVAIQLANVDLALKYAALRLLSNNTQLVNRCLDLVGKTVETMQLGNERFSDTEARLFVPALVIKLGDTKFGSKLSSIFDMLDKVIAASQVVQLLITHGLEDKSIGKSCKNESLALIEKAYRKRGSILRTKDDRGFFEILAKCISDSGTRNAALSVMALLQLQGGSASLTAVVDAMPNSSKDMLANRRATMSTAKSVPAAQAPAIARVTETVDGTPGRIKRPGVASPVASKISRESASVEGSPIPAARTIPRGVASPTSRIAKPSSSSPSTSRMAPPSAALRSIMGPIASTSRLQRPNDMFSAPALTNGRSLQPLPRPASASAASPPRGGRNDRILQLINAIGYDDMDRAVNAMKQVQEDLLESPEQYRDNAQTLCEALLDVLDRAFDPPEKLRDDTAVFRLVKHIINTFNGFCSNQDLMRRLTYDQVYAVISALSLRLVQADRLGGLSQELVQFINMILIQALATPDRYEVFKAMFELLLNLSKDFTEKQVKAEDEVACHADLVIKCLWKRCKVLDDDFASGRLPVGSLLGILEDFLRAVGPAEYRRREKLGVALGDLPLRTVKTMTQRIVLYAKNHGVEIYDILLGEFGDSASDTIVYSYIFRLAGPEADQPRKRTTTASSSRPLSPLLPSSRPSSGMSSRERVSTEEALFASRDQERPRTVQLRDEAMSDAPVKQDTELERLVKNLTANNKPASIDTLYEYIKAHPEEEDNAGKIIMTIHGPTVGKYFCRTLESRRDDNLPSPAKRELPASPAKSSCRPESMPPRASARKSMGPRPSSVVVDNTASVDDQLAQLKKKFASTAAAHMSGSQSPESRGGMNGHAHAGDGGRVSGFGASINGTTEKVGGGEPLSEISLQTRSAGPRGSDVD